MVVVTFPEGQKRECVRGCVGEWLELEDILCPGKGRAHSSELSRTRKSKCFSSFLFFSLYKESSRLQCYSRIVVFTQNLELIAESLQGSPKED